MVMNINILLVPLSLLPFSIQIQRYVREGVTAYPYEKIVFFNRQMSLPLWEDCVLQQANVLFG